MVGLLGVAQGIGERPAPRYLMRDACQLKERKVGNAEQESSRPMARTILLVVVAAVMAWAAYAYFTHSAPLPNFHW